MIIAEKVQENSSAGSSPKFNKEISKSCSVSISVRSSKTAKFKILGSVFSFKFNHENGSRGSGNSAASPGSGIRKSESILVADLEDSLEESKEPFLGQD